MFKRLVWRWVIRWIKKEAGRGYSREIHWNDIYRNDIYHFRWTKEFEKEIGLYG
jgi:hypothetical protein